MSNLKLETELLLNGFIQKAKTGKIFTVTFIKKDGSIRNMNARLGVSKGLTGKGMAYNPISKGLLPVYDMQSKGYRTINFKTIVSVRMEGKKYILK